MESNQSLIYPLFKTAEDFSETSLALLKLKFVSKAADISSSLVSRLLVVISVLFFVLFVNIAIALWVGDLLGKNYYGFLFLALLYAIIGTVILLKHTFIKERANNSIITLLLN